MVDLDGTLCTHDGEYADAKPITETIEQINRLFDAGHRIVIDSSRGWGANRDYGLLTADQLAQWGLKYHVLRVGSKPSADRYVDSRAVRPEELAGLT